VSKTIKNLYIAVDQNTCVACGSCQAWAPDVFAYDKFSIAYNLLDDNTGTVPVPEEMWEDVLPTTVLCPTRAIKYSEVPFESVNFTEDWYTDSPDNQHITYDVSDDEWAADELDTEGKPKRKSSADPLEAKKRYLMEKKAKEAIARGPVINLLAPSGGGCGCGGGGACGCGGGGGGCAH